MHYRLLGPLEVERDGVPLDLGPPKQRAVLGLLLLEADRAVSTDRLVEAVWGERPPASVAAGLQAYVSNLRRVLRDPAAGTTPLVRRPPGYALAVDPADVDQNLFLRGADAARDAVERREWSTAVEAAEAALGQWRGPVLADLRDTWVEAAATGLEQRRSDCTETLVTGLLGAGRVGEALVVAERLHRTDPLREHATWLHMAALHRAGRATEALDVYREHARLLDEELGLRPGPALRDLEGRLLRQDPALWDWPGTPGTSASAVTVEPVPAPGPRAVRAATSPLVGRARELAVIDELVDEAAPGVSWLVLTGPAGIGKTRLAEEAAAAYAATGALVVRSNCVEDAGIPPWWPVRELVRGLGREPDTVLTPPPDTEADAGRYVVYERLDDLLRSADTRRTVLFVDDVQWADPTSLRWLSHLATGTQQAPATVVLTVRDGVGGAELERLLATVARRSRTRQLACTPLTSAEVGELVSLVSGAEVDVTEAGELTEQTGGNPFFVREYARLPREERSVGGVPLAIRSVLRLRLAGVDPAVLEVLQTAAVAGEDLDVDVICAVTGLDRGAMAELVESAADAQLVVAVPGTLRYAFAHGLLRDEVLAGLSGPRRARLHARIADAVGTAGEQGASRRAGHLVAALPFVDPDDVLRACRAAAEEAEQTWASESAAHWWEEAVAAHDLLVSAGRDPGADERDELVVAQVAALARAGRGQTVLDTVDQALVDASRRGRVASIGRLAATLLRTAGAWPWASYGEDPGPLADRLAALEDLVADDTPARVRVLCALAVGRYYDPDPDVPDRLSAEALKLAEASVDDELVADALLARALAFSGVATRAEESVELLERLAHVPHRLASLDDVLGASLLTLALLELGDLSGVVQQLRRGITGSDALRLPVVRVQLRWMEGTVAAWYGDLQAAEQLHARAYDLHRQTELYELGVHEIAALTIRWERGRLDAVAEPLTYRELVPWAETARLLATGHHEEARSLLDETVRGPRAYLWTTHGELTLLAHTMADADVTWHAAEVLDRLHVVEDRLANLGQVGVVGPVALGMARLALATGDEATARRQLALAVEVASRGEGRSALLRCRLLAAQLDGATSAELEDVAAEADELGLDLVAAQARADARRVGVDAAHDPAESA